MNPSNTRMINHEYQNSMKRETDIPVETPTED
jgi:hypothetical protein